MIETTVETGSTIHDRTSQELITLLSKPDKFHAWLSSFNPKDEIGIAVS